VGPPLKLPSVARSIELGEDATVSGSQPQFVGLLFPLASGDLVDGTLLLLHPVDDPRELPIE